VEAVQELAPDRRCVTVATHVEPDGSGTLAVSDMGEGVPPDVREHLFDAFVTTKRGGLGLGLSICRSVVEAHGGRIRLDATARGARFAFTLPR
jgi:two-component system sensor kinase FixL